MFILEFYRFYAVNDIHNYFGNAEIGHFSFN